MALLRVRPHAEACKACILFKLNGVSLVCHVKRWDRAKSLTFPIFLYILLGDWKIGAPVY